MRPHRVRTEGPAEPAPAAPSASSRPRASTVPPASGERLTELARAVMARDAEGDPVSAARARLALGHALLAAGEPAAREILEDAGTCFEELGDEASMLEVDVALRDAASTIEESPRSFHWRASESSMAAALVGGPSEHHAALDVDADGKPRVGS